MNIVIATIRNWHIINAKKFQRDHPEHNVKLIFAEEDFKEEEIASFQPEYILFPHWSWMIPESVFLKYKCIVFHVADVPNARGGSPVQNQIADGMTRTMISAISVDAGLDTGDVYLKRELSLMGGAEEIFVRSSRIIFDEMIPAIISNHIVPKPQTGKGYCYKRRTPQQSELPKDCDLIGLFDHIRMLDADGYPRAFLNWGEFTLEFSRPKLLADGIICDVKIRNE